MPARRHAGRERVAKLHECHVVGLHERALTFQAAFRERGVVAEAGVVHKRLHLQVRRLHLRYQRIDGARLREVGDEDARVHVEAFDKVLRQLLELALIAPNQGQRAALAGELGAQLAADAARRARDQRAQRRRLLEGSRAANVCSTMEAFHILRQHHVRHLLRFLIPADGKPAPKGLPSAVSRSLDHRHAQRYE